MFVDVQRIVSWDVPWLIQGISLADAHCIHRIGDDGDIPALAPYLRKSSHYVAVNHG